jgi:hypothetical protein
MPINKRRSQKKQQKGGNYHFGVYRNKIGGLAEVVRVDDPIPPTALASKDTFPVPLYLQQNGGKRRSSKRSSKRSHHSSKRSPKRSRRSSKRRSHKRQQKGGKAGELSVYTPNMLEREFNCYRPEWSPRCT